LGISAVGQGDQVLVCQKQVLSILAHYTILRQPKLTGSPALVQVLSVAAALRGGGPGFLEPGLLCPLTFECPRRPLLGSGMDRVLRYR
jgi:hypothetical protein